MAMGKADSRKRKQVQMSWGWMLPGVPHKQQGGQYDWSKVGKEKSRKRDSQSGNGVRLWWKLEEQGKSLGWLMSKKSLQKVLNREGTWSDQVMLN